MAHLLNHKLYVELKTINSIYYKYTINSISDLNNVIRTIYSIILAENNNNSKFNVLFKV